MIMDELLTVVIGGDLVVNQEYDAGSQIDPAIVNLFEQADHRIINLEAPVTKGFAKINKTGPHLKCSSRDVLSVLKTLDIDTVTMANNHIMDYGVEGLKDTLSFCAANRIKTVGAGLDIYDASKTLYVSTKIGKLAIVNFAENEWSSASGANSGANPMDVIDNYRQIVEAKNVADFVFVIVHGGNEYNHYPSPRMIKQYRFYADSGADAVIGHHTHCVGGYEIYNNIPIVYSLGNFLFTMQKALPDVWFKGLLFKAILKKGGGVSFEIIPVGQSREDYSLYLLEGDEKNEVVSRIDDINSAIQNPSILADRWRDFVLQKEQGYINTVTPVAGIRNRYLKAIVLRMKLDKLLMNQSFLNETLNRIRCEAHLDVVKEMLKNQISANQK